MTANFFIVLGVAFLVSTYSLEYEYEYNDEYGVEKDPVCGPESCKNLRTVKACHNVQYCISNIWSKKNFSGPRDNVCEICLEMVQEARDQLQSNETMSEIKQVLEGSCNLLALKPAVKICQKLADEFVPELVQMLLSQMDPNAVCTIARLCNNAKLREEQLKSEQCTTCQEFITSATDVVTKASIAELINQYIGICRAMGTYSDACTYYVLQDSAAIINETKKALLHQPCEGIRFCPPGTTIAVSDRLAHISTQTWQKSKQSMCTLCPRFMRHLNFMMKALKTKEKLMNWTLDLCTSLSISNDVCSGIVKQHYELLYSYFKSNTDYNYICTHGLGICSVETESVPVWPLVPALKSPNEMKKIHRVAIETGAVNIKTVKDKPKRIQLAVGDPLPDAFRALPVTRFLASDAGECQACTNMFNIVSQYIGTHQDYVDSILNVTCQDTNDYNGCVAFTKAYGHLFKNPSHIEPEKVCPAMVPFCDGKTTEDILFAKVTPEQNCYFCVDVLDSLNFSTRSRAAEVQVNLALRDTCKSTPSSKHQICDQIADNFLKNIVASVTSDLNSVDTCSYLNLCEPNTKLPEVKKPISGSACKSCLLAVEFVYDELKVKSNANELEDLLRKICKKMPGNIGGTCEMMVDLYLDTLIQMIINGVSPSEICCKLHVCPKTNISPTNEKTHITEVERKVPCNFCLTAVNMIVNQLKDNKTEDEIRKTLDKLCSYMPEEVRETCKTLINQYADEIVDMIVADFNATEICIYLKLCGPNSEAFYKKSNANFGFSVATNEIWRKYNPSGACHFCRLMERSMAVSGYEEQGADEMFGLLTDVCLMNGGNSYGECAKKFSEKIIPFGKKALLEMSDICSEMNICPKQKVPDVRSEERIFRQIQKAVQECAMCETITAIVTNRHVKLNSSKYDFAGNASKLCSSVPSDKKKMCESMLTSYAPSVVNLLTIMKVKPDDVCFELKLCDRNSQTKINLPVSSINQSGLQNLDKTEDCLKGPSYWCANLANAKKCGTVPHCRETVWKHQKL